MILSKIAVDAKSVVRSVFVLFTGGLSTGVIVAIVIAVVFIVVAIIVIIFCINGGRYKRVTILQFLLYSPLTKKRPILKYHL